MQQNQKIDISISDPETQNLHTSIQELSDAVNSLNLTFQAFNSNLISKIISARLTLAKKKLCMACNAAHKSLFRSSL